MQIWERGIVKILCDAEFSVNVNTFYLLSPLAF